MSHGRTEGEKEARRLKGEFLKANPRTEHAFECMQGIPESKNQDQYDVCVARALNYARLGIAKEVMYHYPTWRIISRLYAKHSDSLKRQGMYEKGEGDFANEVTQTMHEGNWDAEFVNTRVAPYIKAILDVGLQDDIEEADRARTRV